AAGPVFFVAQLLVLVAGRRWRRPGEVEEDVARRFCRAAFEIVALIKAIERGLDDARILTGLDLLLEPVAFRSASDIDKRRHPVEGSEQLAEDRAWLDMARPADDSGS